VPVPQHAVLLLSSRPHAPIWINEDGQRAQTDHVLDRDAGARSDPTLQPPDSPANRLAALSGSVRRARVWVPAGVHSGPGWGRVDTLDPLMGEARWFG